MMQKEPYVIEIPPQIRQRQILTVLNPKRELREIIDADLGMEAAKLYDDILDEFRYVPTGDDYEAISDGYRNMLVDVMNELGEIIFQKRLDRKKIERLYDRLNRDL